MLSGIDVSHHNNLNKILSIIDKPDFCIMKATEGKAYKDPMLEINIKTCLKNSIPMGFYHYARPELNTPIEECKNFLDSIQYYSGSALFALDWEDKALKYPIGWARQFLTYFYHSTGVKPLIYTSAWYTKNLKPIFDDGNGLWVAHYTPKEKPHVEVYPFWAIWQYATPERNYTGKECICDYDYFNGNLLQLRKYMEKI